MRRLIPTLVVVGLLAGCAPSVQQHGAVIRPEVLSELQPGMQTKDDVLRMLGSPSTVAPFDDNAWYYISEKSRDVAFFRPETIDRRVLIVRFDQQGVLDQLGMLGPEDGREITIASRETPTAGHRMTILEQFVGNVGRFN